MILTLVALALADDPQTPAFDLPGQVMLDRAWDIAHLDLDLEVNPEEGRVEGTSTLLLFLVAMPLKYAADMPMAVTIVGSLHGALFVAYLVLLAVVQITVGWPIARSLLLAVGAVIPFGPFVLDHRIKRWAEADAAAAQPAEA